MFAGKVIGQAVTRHFRGPVESGICFGNPQHHLKLNGAAVMGYVCYAYANFHALRRLCIFQIRRPTYMSLV